MRDPVGPGDVGRRPFDASPRLQLVSAGVHHTNTETERPDSILPRRCVACSGRCLARACCRRSVGQPAGSALSRASRSQVGCLMRPIRRSFVSLPPIHPLRDLTAAGANLFRVQARLLRTSPLRHAMALTTNHHRVRLENLRQCLDQCPFMYRFHIATIGPD